MNKILMSGGGSLGSVSPLLAIAQEFSDCDYLFLTTRKGPEVAFLNSRGIRTRPIAAGKFRRYADWRNITDLFKIVSGFFQSLVVISQYKPDLVLTSGGYVAVPVAIAAKLLGKYVFVHQQDMEAGLANRIMARFANCITVTFEEQKKFFPSHKTIVLGNPVRKFDETGDIEEDSIVIFGGSQGARGLNDFVNQLIPEWTKHTNVIHIVGQSNYHQRLSLDHNYEVIKFANEKIAEILKRAKVVITRGGISMLTELSHIKKASVIVAMPESHQETNARFFVEKQAAVMTSQGDLNAMKSVIDLLLTNREKAQQLGQNLYTLFRPNATEEYVKLIKNRITLNIAAKPKAFFAGIGGIGTSALAQHFLATGYKVVGSDISRTEITSALEQRGADIFYEQKKSNIADDVSIFIYSSALPSNHDELVEAKRRHIPTFTYNEYLGKVAADKFTIAISGTNGKTTTTGMAAYMTTATGLDPTVIVGGLIPQLEQPIGNYRPGKSAYFVVEACEFRSHMLHIPPRVIVLTNIEEDHLDYYRDLNHIKAQFQKFVDMLPTDGLLIRNLDDPNMKEIATDKQQITYGFDERADYCARAVEMVDGFPKFDLYVDQQKHGTVSLQLHGTFNIANSLAIIALAGYLKTDLNVAIRAVENFTGSWRRFEKIGNYNNTVPVYSDYGHHPTAIENVIEAAKTFYPKRNVFIVFQPHTYSRTQSMFERFADSFRNADKVLICKTYEVMGRQDVTSAKDVAEELAGAIKVPGTEYGTDTVNIQTKIKARLQDNDVLLFVGAGDIDSLARNFVRNA